MESHRSYLEIAMQEAEIAFNNKTYPVGAVIVDLDGKVISQGHNLVYNEGIFTSHAEIEAIRAAGHQLMKEQNFGSCTLYTTLEPCLMCCGAIIHAKIKRVIWIKDDKTYGALRCLHRHAKIKRVIWGALRSLHKHARIKRVIWGALRSSHKSAYPLSSFYASKFYALEISRACERDLARRMDEWMESWNSMKDVVLNERQHDYMQEESCV